MKVNGVTGACFESAFGRKAEMDLIIDVPGVYTTVQDGGRTGFQQYGIRESGVMDREAFAAANAILGNEPDAAVLEMTLMGLTCHFDGDGVIALTGADMNAELDGVPVERYQAIRVHSGQRLTLSIAVDGCRAYLGAAGGIDVPEVLGSRATDVRSSLGGFCGRLLRAGDRIHCMNPRNGACADAAARGKSREETDVTGMPEREETARGTTKERRYDLPHYGHKVEVRVVEGPQADWFSAEEREQFFANEYTVTAESDRMGIRLQGRPIESLHGVDIVSDGIVSGSIQIPKNGMPIILMVDHQTTGGYAKPGTVCSFDLPRLAQVRPGDKVSFRKISVEEAQRLLLHPVEQKRSGPLGFHRGSLAQRQHSRRRRGTRGRHENLSGRRFGGFGRFWQQDRRTMQR